MISWACSFQAGAQLQFQHTLNGTFRPFSTSSVPQKWGLTDRQDRAAHGATTAQSILGIQLSDIPVQHPLCIWTQNIREESDEEDGQLEEPKAS